MAVATIKVKQNNDVVAEIIGLQNAVSLAYFNAATVSVVFNDTSGTEVLSAQTLSYVAASDGNYRVTIDKAAISAVLTLGVRYKAVFTASESGVDGEWEADFVYAKRSVN